MAQINLLKANYTGSIGNTTGVNLSGQSVIKAKIWSKAPASRIQKNNVRAFESLNRICGVLARKWADWLPVKKGNVMLHNALATYFKDVISDHQFNIKKFADYADGTSEIQVTQSTYNRETGLLKLKASATLQDFDTGLEQWAIIVCDAKANIMLFVNPKATEYQTEQIVACPNPQMIYILCFASSKKGGKTHFTACHPIEREFDGVWYTSITQSVISATFNASTSTAVIEADGIWFESPDILHT